MGGDHHEAPYKIPDWQQYKVENAPRLLKIQQRLEKEGLKSPWLRNAVWRYDKKYYYTIESKELFRSLFRGFPIGLVVALAIIGIEKKMGGNHHEGEHK